MGIPVNSTPGYFEKFFTQNIKEPLRWKRMVACKRGLGSDGPQILIHVIKK